MRPRGGINPIGVLLILGIAAGIYWSALFGPLYLDNITVKEAAEVGLSGYLDGPENIRMLALRRINGSTVNTRPIGSHMEENDKGELVEVAGLGLTDADVAVDYDESKRFARVTITYSRTVRLVPTHSVRTVSFRVEKEKRF